MSVANYLSLAVIAASSFAADASPVVLCVAVDGTHYFSNKQFIRDISMQQTANSLDNSATDLLLTHCPSKTLVRVKPTDESPDLGHAYNVIVNMIADNKEQTFDDVVKRMEWQKYTANIETVPADGCLCSENM